MKSHGPRCIPLVVSLLLVYSLPAGATDVFLCEDDQGSRSFYDRCPPGTTPVDHRQYSTRSSAPAAGPQEPITLYLVPNCDSCEQVKEFLAVRDIRPVEKDVASNAALQEELKELAGDLRVPVTVIGDRVLGGYDRSELLDALSEEGYAPAPTGEEGGEEEQLAEAGADEFAEPELADDTGDFAAEDEEAEFGEEEELGEE